MKESYRISMYPLDSPTKFIFWVPLHIHTCVIKQNMPQNYTHTQNTMCLSVPSHVRLCNPTDCSWPGPLSMEFFM